MIDFKELEELTLSDLDDVNHFIELMSGFVPLVDEGDYLLIKRYIRKILEIIERDNGND